MFTEQEIKQLKEMIELLDKKRSQSYDFQFKEEVGNIIFSLEYFIEYGG